MICLKNKLLNKLFSWLAIALLMFSAIPLQEAAGLNASGNKGFNFQGYRYVDKHTIRVWLDKSTILTTADLGKFRIYAGNSLNGHQLQLDSAVYESSSNVSNVSGLGNGACIILTTAADEAFVPGSTYTVALNSTLKAKSGMTLGNHHFHQDIVFAFTVPQVEANANTGAVYSDDAPVIWQSWPENGETNLPLEGNIWFQFNLPVQNYDEVKAGLVLKKDGVSLKFDSTMDGSKDGDIYSPLVTDDHTMFFFPMIGGGSAYSYNLEPGAQYTLEIPAVQAVNGQTIPAQTLTFRTASEVTPTKVTGALTTIASGSNLELKWPAAPELADISPAATGYNVYVSQNPNWDFMKLNAAPVTATSYVVSGLNPDTTYYFRVAPLNGTSEGGLSDYVQAVMPNETTGPNDDGTPTNNFIDLKGHWAADDIEYLTSKQIVKGVSAELFKPDASVTRAEFAALIARLIQLPPASTAQFSDVISSAWYADVVNSAAENGLLTGYNHKFRPLDKITREEMAVIMIRAYTLKAGMMPVLNGQVVPFKDDAGISSWASAAVYQAQELGLIQGRPNGTFGPKKTATRAEACVMIKRMLDKTN